MFPFVSGPVYNEPSQWSAPSWLGLYCYCWRMLVLYLEPRKPGYMGTKRDSLLEELYMKRPSVELRLRWAVVWFGVAVHIWVFEVVVAVCVLAIVSFKVRRLFSKCPNHWHSKILIIWSPKDHEKLVVWRIERVCLWQSRSLFNTTLVV